MRIYPAIRARMGDWQYYMVRMKMREIARKVQLSQDIYEDRTIRDAVQRALGEKRVKTEIVGYLARRPDRFFSSIVVAAMEGEPSWHPVEVDTSTVPKILTSSSSMRDSFGVLSFGDEPKYYALDGQHRVAAIKLLINRQAEIEAPPGFDDDLLSVIVVLREEYNVSEGEWMRRYRRLFSSLSRYAKPTDRDTNIIMDEDDLFAIVTRRLITDHEFFRAPGLERESFKVLTRGKSLKEGTSHFTTLQTLYAINTILLKTSRRQMLGWDHAEPTSGDPNKQIRPDEEYIDGYYEELSNYWDAILAVLPDLGRQPSEMRNHDTPGRESGQYCDHLLFWPIGQELFARIARSLLDDAQVASDADISSLKTALQPLAEVPWDLHHAPWRYLLLVPKTPEEESWRMRNEDRKEALEYAYHLLRWVVGLDPLNEQEKEELRSKWENLLLRPRPRRALSTRCGRRLRIREQESLPAANGHDQSSMKDFVIKCSARSQGNGDTEPGYLALRLGPNGKCGDNTFTVADRLARAAEWVMDLDVQYRDLIHAGRSPQVNVPAASYPKTGRAHRETSADYRKLRLGIGELIRPLLLDPPKLKALYPFQRQGAEWLVDQRGAILADDMGLGKTVQVIAAMRLLFNRAMLRSALVVCPKGLVSTWERELGRWAPELGVAILTPPAQIREDAWKTVAGRSHVLLTNYEQLRHPPAVLRRNAPDLVVADEAHRLRNRDARITSGSFQLKPGRFWALTGTPLERDLEDLATLLSLVVPARFAPADGKLHPSSLRSRARPYVLRRRKQEVLEELPPVLDTIEMLDLSEAQERAYRDTVKQYRRRGERGDELALLTRLQALCDIDPESRESCKVERILDLLGRIREQREKAVVFSHRLEPLRELRRRIAERWGEEAAALLIGEMDSEEREHAVTRFRSSDHQALALLASTRIGGEGLTLVEANHVFLFNQWWNPSANDQARDRVVRIGQRRKVRVYRFCCRGTIEEALERILKSKRALFDDAVERLAESESAAWNRVLSEVGMERLLSESTPVAGRGSG